MRYGSVCSGIEAATAAWHPLGWEPAFFSEIEKFPRAVLEYHYPDVPLHGDFTTIGAKDYGSIDLLVGGTPCQSFSIAGLRKGLDDERGNLALEYLLLAQRKRPQWLVWENVPGVLSSNGGRDFGAFLGALGELGYGFAYRVLDAQYFGVAQRRRRVFVVGYSGDWRPAAAVLFERHSLSGHPAPRREAGEKPAPTIRAGAPNGGPGHGARSGDSKDELIVPVAHTLRAEHDASEDGTGRGTPILPVMSSGQANAEICDNLSPALNCNRDRAPIALALHGTQDPGLLIEAAHPLGRNSGQENAVALPINTQVATCGDALGEGTGFGIGDDGDPAFTLQSAHSHGVAVCENQRGELRESDATNAMSTGGGKPGQGYPAVRQGMAVRRLTPVECERLQGFPDNFTAIPWRGKTVDNCPDGPRYKALGNSMAVPCMVWLGERIQVVQGILDAKVN